MEVIVSIAHWLLFESIYGTVAVAGLAYAMATAVRRVIPKAPSPVAIAVITGIAGLIVLPGLGEKSVEFDRGEQALPVTLRGGMHIKLGSGVTADSLPKGVIVHFGGEGAPGDEETLHGAVRDILPRIYGADVWSKVAGSPELVRFQYPDRAIPAFTYDISSGGALFVEPYFKDGRFVTFSTWTSKEPPAVTSEYSLSSLEEWCDWLTKNEAAGERAPTWAAAHNLRVEGGAIRDKLASILNGGLLEKVQNRAPRMAWVEGETLHIENISALLEIEPEVVISGWREGLERGTSGNPQDARDLCLYGTMARLFDEVVIHTATLDSVGGVLSEEITRLPTDRRQHFGAAL